MLEKYTLYNWNGNEALCIEANEENTSFLKYYNEKGIEKITITLIPNEKMSKEDKKVIVKDFSGISTVILYPNKDKEFNLLKQTYQNVKGGIFLKWEKE